ncbi:chain-length determining protein [Babesia caballi]|uniref:Chain-length determining protein n=1 Tax=Babesia caballi TaxID=5871 RepID=A0AAV4LZA0_BABCB|nr:chain-length determining protein [Babesia caballi]
MANLQGRHDDLGPPGRRENTPNVHRAEGAPVRDNGHHCCLGSLQHNNGRPHECNRPFDTHFRLLLSLVMLQRLNIWVVGNLHGAATALSDVKMPLHQRIILRMPRPHVATRSAEHLLRQHPPTVLATASANAVPGFAGTAAPPCAQR